MPECQSVLDESSGYNCWVFLDMKSGFLNVPVLLEAMKVLGLVTQDGFYRFRRMPFGLLAAPLWF